MKPSKLAGWNDLNEFCPNGMSNFSLNFINIQMTARSRVFCSLKCNPTFIWIVDIYLRIRQIKTLWGPTTILLHWNCKADQCNVHSFNADVLSVSVYRGVWDSRRHHTSSGVFSSRASFHRLGCTGTGLQSAVAPAHSLHSCRAGKVNCAEMCGVRGIVPLCPEHTTVWWSSC